MSNPVENLKQKIKKTIELELFENKISKIRIKIMRKTIMVKGLKELKLKNI